MKNSVFILFFFLFSYAFGQGEESASAYFGVKEAYALELRTFTAKMKAASQEEQRSMMKDAPDWKAYKDTLLHFISKYPEQEFVADAWVEVYKLQVMRRNDSLYKVAMKELAGKHGKSKYLANLDPIYLSKSRSAEIGNFMEQILAQTESDDVKGIFSLAYADWLTQRKEAPQYDLEKGLALLDEVIEKYPQVEYKKGPEQIPVTTGSQAESSKQRLTKLTVGNVAPEIVSRDLSGKEVKLSDHKGKVVMLDIWATWCGPCVKMIPEETKMVNRLKDQPFELISISIDKRVETVEKFHKRMPMPWTHWFNGDKGGVLDQWNVHQYPTIILLDKEGVIRYRFDEAIEEEKLNHAINQLLKI